MRIPIFFFKRLLFGISLSCGTNISNAVLQFYLLVSQGSWQYASLLNAVILTDRLGIVNFFFMISSLWRIIRTLTNRKQEENHCLWQELKVPSHQASEPALPLSPFAISFSLTLTLTILPSSSLLHTLFPQKTDPTIHTIFAESHCCQRRQDGIHDLQETLTNKQKMLYGTVFDPGHQRSKLVLVLNL